MLRLINSAPFRPYREINSASELLEKVTRFPPATIKFAVISAFETRDPRNFARNTFQFLFTAQNDPSDAEAHFRDERYFNVILTFCSQIPQQYRSAGWLMMNRLRSSRWWNETSSFAPFVTNPVAALRVFPRLEGGHFLSNYGTAGRSFGASQYLAFHVSRDKLLE